MKCIQNIKNRRAFSPRNTKERVNRLITKKNIFIPLKFTKNQKI